MRVARDTSRLRTCRACRKSSGRAAQTRCSSRSAHYSKRVKPAFAASLLLTVLTGFMQPACAAGEGGRRLAMRGISRVCRAAAPPGSSGLSEEFGPRRALGSVDIDGRGVQHELSSFGPFVLLEDALLPRGKMPPFGKHPHAGTKVLAFLVQKHKC